MIISPKLLRLGVLLVPLILAACQSAKTLEPTLPPVQNTAAPRSTATPRDTDLPPTATALPSATRTRRPTATLVPTSTALPSFTPGSTATITPVPTIAPPLDEARPYLVYDGLADEAPVIILLNDNGVGRRVLPLPKNSLLPSLPDALSPDGRWLALYSGSAGDPAALSQSKGPFDLSLSLMHLPDGAITPVSKLLSDAFPKNLEQLARQMAIKQPAARLSEPQWTDELWGRFLAGISKAQWSPNGQTLAFARQQDGLSLDLYLYTLSTGAVTRAAGADEPLQWMLWSPDGAYLLHGRASRACTGCETTYALNINTGEISALSGLMTAGAQTMLYDWGGPHQMVFYNAYTSGGQGALRTIDAATGVVTDLYADRFVVASVDNQKPLLALFLDANTSAKPPIEAGVHLVRPATGQRDLAAPVAKYERLKPIYWGAAAYRFLLQGENKIYGLSEDGQVAQLAEGRFWGFSRNRAMVVVGDSNNTAAGLSFYDNRGQLVRQASAEFAGDLFWNTSSTGLFSVYDSALYYLDLATGSWALVDSRLPEPTWSEPTRIRYGLKK